MTRLLITGINGFTGRHVVNLVRAHDYELFGIGHTSDAELGGVATQYAVDLQDLHEIKRIVKEIRPELVLHLAGAAFVGRSDVESFYKTNLIGTRNLLEALEGLDQAPRGVLLASSANVYGNFCTGEITETMAARPANEYGVSKLAMEFVARIAARSLPIVVTRPFNYTGRGQSTDFLIPKIVAHLKNGASSIKLGNLDVARDFSDVRDVARAYMRLLQNPEAIGETVNICSGRAYELREIVAMAEQLSGRRLAVELDPNLVRPNEISALWGDRTKLSSLMHDDHFIPLSDTIAWMLNA